MQRKEVLAVLAGWLVLGGSVAASQVATESSAPATGATVPLEVRYLANEGFLVAGAGRRVLIDALFGAGVDGYPIVPADLRGELEAGSGEWGHIDLALATHYHADHFDPQAVLRFLEAQPDAAFVSTPQAVGQLRKRVAPDDARLRRVHSAFPDEGTTENLILNEIDIQVLNLHHGRNRRPAVENLGYIVTLGDDRFLHFGDTEAKMEDFEPYLGLLQDTELALLPFWFLSSEWRAQMVRERIRPQEIIVAHLPLPNAPAGHFARWESYDNLLDVIRQAFPQARIPTATGDRFFLASSREATLVE